MSLLLFPILSICKFEFFICNNNLYIPLSFHFTYDTDEEIIDFEIYMSIISNDVIDIGVVLPSHQIIQMNF